MVVHLTTTLVRRPLVRAAFVALTLAAILGRGAIVRTQDISAQAGTPPAVGDIIFNEYASDNDANGNDFFELLVLRDGVDLRGLRVSDNELLTPTGALNTNESVFVFGNDAFLSNVPRGTLIAVYTLATGVTTDTVVNPAASDWKMVLAPGTGITASTDGLGGSLNAGLATGGDALYLYLPGPDGNSAGTDNIYLDYISFEDDGGAVAPAGLVDINLPSLADNAYYTGNTAAGNDLNANWVRYDGAPNASTTPGDPNPGQDLSGLRAAPVLPDLTIALADAPDPVLVGQTLTYTISVGLQTASASGITATFTLPAGATFGTANGDHGFTAVQSSGVVTYSGGSLNPGETATLTATVTPLGVGTLTSGAAVVDPSNTITESNEDNNTAAAVTTTVTAIANTLPAISAIPSLSGAIADPTNPSSAFTVSDAETAASALVVEATATSNAAVAPLANVTFGGSGMNRTIGVNPAGVGYADITVRVTDGGGLSATSTLHYAASAASLTPSTTRFPTGASDASAAVAVDGAYMLVGDDENQTIRMYARGVSGAPVKSWDFTSSLGLTDLSSGTPREVDIEAATRTGSRVLWIGSHSNAKDDGAARANRLRLFATDLSGLGADTELAYAGRYDHLRTDLVAWDSGNGHGLGAGYYGLAASTAVGVPPDVPNATGLNIEGLTMAPDGTTGYVAFRAPLVPRSHRGRALIVPVLNVALLPAADGGVAGTAQFGAPIELDLGGRGIRSIDRNGAGDYVVIAGPVDNDTGVAPKDFRLFTWSGNAADAAVLRDANLTALAAAGSFESMVDVPAPLQASSVLQVLVDNGDTVFYNDGIAAKDLAEPAFKKFRSEQVALGAALPPEATPSTGARPTVGDIIFNEYASDNDANGNDFVELLVLGDNLDLRGLRFSDNELATPTGALNVNESVLVFGNDAFLTNVPRGTLIAVYMLAAGVVTDTVVNPSANDWKMVLAPGTGVTGSVDGLGGSLNLGLSTGGEGLYLYLPGADGTSAGTDNVYLDYMSFEDDQAVAPAGLVDLNLPSVADNAYYIGNTATGNDLAANWVRYDGAPNASTTPGEPNPAQDLSPLRTGGTPVAGVTVTESGGSTSVAEGGATDTYTIALKTVPSGAVDVQASSGARCEVSANGIAFGHSATVTLTTTLASTVTVRAVDDALFQGPTTCTIAHSIVSSGDPAYSDTLTPIGSVVASVVDNDVVVTAIHDIQGPGATSPLVGQSVITRGIVIGIKSNGFFIQEPDNSVDGLAETSEGIQIFTNAAPAVSRGDLVQVSGTVSEFVPSADLAQPPLTEIVSPSISILSSGNALPTPTEITVAMSIAPNAEALLERLEGMRVSIPSLTVVGPTLSGSSNEPNATSTSNGIFYGVVTGVPRPFREPGIDIHDPLPPGSPCCVPRFDSNPERLRIDSDAQAGAAQLDLTAGVVVTGIVGPLDYGFRTYTVLPDAGSAVLATPNAVFTAVPAPSADEVTVAGQNFERFFDTVNDPSTSDPVLTATAFNNRLNKASLTLRNVLRTPDVIGVVEMENLTTLQALADRVNADAVAAGQPNPQYTAYLVEGNDIGGIDVGFLVKSRIAVLSVHQEGLNATYVNPNNGQSELLNDRPPLVLDARAIRADGTPFDFSVVINHLRSLLGMDDPVDGPRVRAKRRAQAEYLATLLRDMRTANPDVRVLAIGDFNAFEVNDGYVDVMGTARGAPAPANQVVLASSDLVDPDLVDLVTSVPADNRYSYVFDGNAQVLDHALANTGLLPWVSRFAFSRSNADFPETARNDASRPERLSDHDGTVTYLALGTLRVNGRILNVSPRAGGQMTIDVQVSNVGAGNALNVTIDSLTLKTLTGAGTVTPATALPIAVGSLAPGQSTVVSIVVNVPDGVTRFAMIENGSAADAGGAVSHFQIGTASSSIIVVR